MAIANDERARATEVQAASGIDAEAQVQAILQRPYRMVVQGEPKGGYLAYVPELPGCITAGATPTEAMDLLRDAMASWLAAAVEDGDEIPDPLPPVTPVEEWRRYNGKFLFRMPRSVHMALAQRATEEGTSLNQLVLTYVGRGLGSA